MTTSGSGPELNPTGGGGGGTGVRGPEDARALRPAKGVLVW